MEIIIALIITVVLIGIPTWLVLKAVKKAEKNTDVYSPEEVTQKFQRGFFLSQWGLEFAFGSILSFVLIFCNIHIVIKFVIPISLVVVGLIMFFIGRFQVGMTTRYLNFCNRNRTELEELILNSMQKIECLAMQANGINTITKLTPGVTDDMLVALNSKDLITGFSAVASIYMGKNTLKKHWPIISILQYNIFAHTSQFSDCHILLYLVIRFSCPCVCPYQLPREEYYSVKSYNKLR